eukprot:jgi/Tetstr1/425776/TSEL_001561.t1
MEVPRGEALREARRRVSAALREAAAAEMPTGGEFHTAAEGRIKALLGGLPGVNRAKAAAFDVRQDASDDSMEEVLDGMTDQLAILLDRHRRGDAVKRGAEQQPLGGTAPVAKRAKAGRGVFTPEGSRGVARPQDSFSVPVDNSNVPFEHQRGAAAAAASTPPLRRWKGLSYASWQLEAGEPVPAGSLEETPFVFVDTPQALDDLVASLAGAREVAVDLESHSYRSFQGFTCLMQLSTRAGDWVVDTLALRDLIRPKLGPLFSDPGVEKVLHGADHDVTWLQRDFRIYLVNLFDTGQAARVLGFPSFGLAYLMNHYCAVKVDKRHQLADWRVRPLPDEMLRYARMDTHDLLYIRDRLKAELAALGAVPPELAVPPRPGSNAGSGALGTVLERSRRLCFKLYQKELFTETSYLEDLKRNGGVALDARQAAVYAALFAWRDRVARSADESPGYVLPRAGLNALVRAAPRSWAELAAALRPLPPLVEAHGEALLKAVADAAAQAALEEVPVAGEAEAAGEAGAEGAAQAGVDCSYQRPQGRGRRNGGADGAPR